MSFLFKGAAKDKVAKTDEPKAPRTTAVIFTPLPDEKPAPPPALHPGDEEKLRELEQHVAEYRQAHPCEPAYAKYEEAWLQDNNVYKRYLRATRGDLRSSKRRIIVRIALLRTPSYTGYTAMAPRVQTGNYPAR